MEKHHETSITIIIGDGLASLEWLNWRLLEAKICCGPWVLARSPTKMPKPACESVDCDYIDCWSEDGKILFRKNATIFVTKSNVFLKHNFDFKGAFAQIHLHPCLCLRNSAARCVVRACGRARSKCTEWAPLYMKCVIRRASGKTEEGFIAVDCGVVCFFLYKEWNRATGLCALHK